MESSRFEPIPKRSDRELKGFKKMTYFSGSAGPAELPEFFLDLPRRQADVMIGPTRRLLQRRNASPVV